MLDRFARPLKDKILIPAAESAGRFVTPNQISAAAFLSGLISALFILAGNLSAAFLFWIVNRILDGLDGTVARVTGRISDFGAYLDLVLDLIIYTVIPSSFVYYSIIFKNAGQDIFWSAIFLLSVFYINLGSWTLLSAVIEKRKNPVNNDKKNEQLTSLTMPSGIIEGTETVVFYSLFYIFPDSILILFILMGILTSAGAVQRWFWAAKNIK